jgi:hypothetical protein
VLLISPGAGFIAMYATLASRDVVCSNHSVRSLNCHQEIKINCSY